MQGLLGIYCINAVTGIQIKHFLIGKLLPYCFLGHRLQRDRTIKVLHLTHKLGDIGLF